MSEVLKLHKNAFDDFEVTAEVVIACNYYCKGMTVQELVDRMKSYAVNEITKPGYGGTMGFYIVGFVMAGTNEIAYKAMPSGWLVNNHLMNLTNKKKN